MTYRNLLSFIDPEKVKDLTMEDIELYADEWRKEKKRESSSLSAIFSSEGALEEAILNLKNNLPLQKKIFLDEALNDFFSDYSRYDNLPEKLGQLLDYHISPWLKKMVTHHFLEGFRKSFAEPGIQSSRLVKYLTNLYQSALPDDYREVIDRKLPPLISQEIENIDEVSWENLIATHYANTIANLPSGQAENYKELLGQKLVDKINHHLLIDDDVSLADGRNKQKEVIKNLRNAAKIAYKLTGDAKMKKANDNFAKKLKDIKKQDQQKGNGLRNAIIGIACIAAAAFLYYLYHNYQDGGDAYNNRYKAYQEELKEFKTNRKLSEEMIEQRKKVEITDTYQYGEKDNVTLFYTFIQTNKYLNINEIDNELYKLRNLINPDSLDVNEIFIKAHFYVTDKSNPYREVTANYNNLHQTPEYKQLTKPRATKSFTVNKVLPTAPYRLNVQLSEAYTSGILDRSIYDLYIYPEKEMLEVYVHNPMPSLERSISLQDIETLEVSDLTNDAMNVAKTSLAIYHYLDDAQARYRSPIENDKVSFTPQLGPYDAMFNWELTLSDDLAFYRIRSEDIGGYYLMDRDNGRVRQVRLTIDETDPQLQYLISLEE